MRFALFACALAVLADFVPRVQAQQVIRDTVLYKDCIYKAFPSVDPTKGTRHNYGKCQ